MKNAPTRASLLACASLCVVTTSAFAASQTWDGETDANWGTTTNWVANAVPGIIYTSNATNTGDVATFNAAINGVTNAGSGGNPIIAETNRMIGRIVFDTAGAGSHFIGSAITPPTLTFGNNLTIVDVTTTVVNPQTFNAPVALHLPSSTNGAYTIQNNSTTSSATLTFAGGLLNSPNSTRGTVATIRGTNTGENTVSGNIVLTNTGGITSRLNKSDAGTWVLAGTNTFASGGGVTITDGVLAAANNAALGTNGTANTQSATINGGVLEIRNGITINNGVSLNLNHGGTIRGAGTAGTQGRINVGTAAATSATLNTVDSGDVFTIGNGNNDFTGGASDSVVHITGAGTVFQSVASNYAGTWSVDAGTLSLGSSTALGTLGSVNVASGAKVQTLGNNISLTALTGSGAVSNDAAATASTVTANIASAETFAGQLTNGVAGTLGLIKAGAGTLNLSGVSSYTEATTIGTGVLNLTGSLGNTAVSGGSGATLSGTGTISGGVTASSGVHIAPGDGGNAALGTLTTGALTLNADSQLDFGIIDPSTLDQIAVSSSDGLTINGGQLNINGGLTAFTAIGDYPLIAYSGTIGGAGVGSLTVNGLNKSVTRTYTFSTTAVPGFVSLVVADSGVSQTFWNVDADGSWGTAGDWTPATIPDAVGAFAGFGGGGTAITAPRTVTVDGSFTAGTLSFNNPAQAFTLAAGTGANITLDNNLAPALVTGASGNHAINSPLTLTTHGATFTVVNGADTLTTGGVISGNGGPLVKGGAGTLVLTGANDYLGGTTINAGKLEINSPASMGDSTGITTINAGTLRTTADIVSTRTFKIGDLASTVSVAGATTYTLDGMVEDGSNVGVLNKSGTGTLVLNNTNSYTGGTVISAGTVSISNPLSLGTAAGAMTINNGTLRTTASFAGTRNLSLGDPNSTLSVDIGQTYTVNGPISGAGALNKTGTGTLALGGTTNSFSGGTVIHSGILAINLGSFLGPGTLLFQGGTLQNNYGTNNTYGLANPISIPTGETGTINMGNRMSLGAGAEVTGGGTLNVNLNTTATRDDLNNSWTGFTGQVNFAGSGTARLLNNSGTFNTNSFANCAVDIGGNAFLQPVTNSTGNTYPIGALSGSSATAGFAGGTAGTATLSIGALGTVTTFAGQINGNNAVTKVGSGTLTLSGTYSYTGNTTVTAGTLSLSTGTLSDNSTVSVSATNGAILNLNFTGTDAVDEFSIDGVLQADGIYGAIGSNAQFETERITGSGRLQVLPDDTFLPWIAQFPTLIGADALKGADPDQDGLLNFEEFALDGNPTTGADTGKVRARIETVGLDQVLVITLPVRNGTGALFAGATSKSATRDGLIYTIAGSNDLAAFDQVVTEITPASTIGMPTPLGTGWTYHTFRLEGAIGGATPRAPRGFLDLKIEVAP